MPHNDIPVLLQPEEIRARLEKLKEKSPGIRTRDAAKQLEVSEAELVACRVGSGVRRLDTRWKNFIEGLGEVGEVMALTRNEHCVHEKHGTFSSVSLSDTGGAVLDNHINLRIAFTHWHYAFEVTEKVASGLRRSVQVFDADGTAVHKIYVTEKTSTLAFDRLIAHHLDEKQDAFLDLVPSSYPLAERPDTEIDCLEMRKVWEEMQDTRDFISLLKKFGISRLQALRLAGEGKACRIDNQGFPRTLEKAAEQEFPITILVSNPGVIQRHIGPVRKLKEMGPWFNVLDENFNLHLKMNAVSQTWVVTKPGKGEQITSVEIYDENGEQIALISGEHKEKTTECPAWRDLVTDLRKIAV